MGAPVKHTSVAVSVETAERLRNHCHETGMKIGWVVEKAIEEWLRKRQDPWGHGDTHTKETKLE